MTKRALDVHRLQQDPLLCRELCPRADTIDNSASLCRRSPIHPVGTSPDRGPCRLTTLATPTPPPDLLYRRSQLVYLPGGVPVMPPYKDMSPPPSDFSYREIRLVQSKRGLNNASLHRHAHGASGRLLAASQLVHLPGEASAMPPYIGMPPLPPAVSHRRSQLVYLPVESPPYRPTSARPYLLRPSPIGAPSWCISLEGA